MRLTYLAYSFSLTIMYFSFVLLVPAVVALYYKESEAVLPFLIAAAAAFLISITLKKIVKGTAQIKSINDIKKSEGLCVVTFSWLFAGILAAIPYLFFGISPIDALFESTSGITTTGSTILTHFNYPHAVFFWRSFTQWLGGMGIIVLFIAILPQFAIAGRQLFFAEAPGPTEDKFTPRIKNTAAALWKVYAGLTVVEIIMLKHAGMSGFEAVCNSLASISGGGLSPNAMSIIGFSNTVLWVTTFFMFFAGVSFNLQYRAWTKLNPLILFKNEEFRVYFWFVIIISLALSASLFFNMHFGIWESITHAFFNISTLISSTGFCSDDFVKWDYTSKVLLFAAMMFGSCASSAGGGLKVMRWLLVYKIMKTEMVKILHPKAVFDIKINDYSVPKDILYQTLMFVSFYFAIIAISAFLLAIVEKNTVTAITGAVSALGNIGPGFGAIGPLASFEPLHTVSKIILIIDMFVGRLELIPFLVLFQKDLWILKK